MQDRNRCAHRNHAKSGLGLWVLLAVCAWVYWPGLSGPPLLDDGANLRVIYSLEESPDYLADIVLGNQSGPIGRPISMLSFGVEQLYASDGVRGFKLRNLALHLVCGCVVVWLAFRLMPVFERGSVPAQWAVLMGGMWLLTPMFVSTTLYIVQRMTQLSALFGLLGLLVYVIGRLRLDSGRRVGWFSMSLVLPFAVASMLSKENGAMLLPAVILTEWAAWKFRVANDPGSTRVLRIIHGALVVGGTVAFVAYAAQSERTLLGGYEIRDFNLVERLMTEARVLRDYIWHLLVPVRDGLGLYHDDYAVSRGLMRPWSTLAALLLWALAIGVALWRLARGRSVLGYGLLFFLLAHAVESTVIPLEIYFEHRNYLPAFGLYFALVLLMRRVVQSAAWASAPVMAGFAVWLTVAAMQTGVQASLWSREITLLRDALHTHPASVRANASLAAVYARMGDTDMARRYAERAATLDEPGHLRHGIRRLALLCIANAPLDPAVVQNLDRQLTSAALQDAGVSESLQVLVERSNREECPKLELGPVTAVFAQRLLSADPPAAAPKVYGLLAILENYLGHAAERDAYLARWLEREPDSVQAWMIQFTVATASADSRLREESLAELQRLERAGLVSREQSDDIELLRRDWPAGPRQDGGKLR